MNENAPTTTAAPCEIHKKHFPSSYQNEVHHVWPRGEGGPDIPANRVVVCATGHNNIHLLISQYKIHRGNLPWSYRKNFTKQERDLAELGYDRLTRGSM